MVDSFTRDSITGSFLTDFVPYWTKITSGQIPGEVDPAFDPFKEYANPEWLNAHPYMIDSFLEGDVYDIPNRQRFEWFMARQKNDYDIRQRLGSAGLAKSITAAIPGQIIDGLVGGLALRGLGLAGKAAQAGEWLKAGGFAAQTGKAALMGGALNVAQEEALRALNPTRHVDEGQAALWALGLGAAFGSGAHMLASGKTRMGKWLDPVRAKIVSQRIAEDLSDPKFHGLDDVAAADAEMLKSELVKVASPEMLASDNRKRVIAEMSAAFSEEQANTIAPVVDAYARSWSKSTGKPVDEFYSGLRVEKGGTPGDGALFQKGASGNAQGSFELAANGQRVIRALTNPDASTLPHEVAHDFLEHLPVIDGKLAEDAATALGAKNFASLKTSHKERFARGFEAYLRSGKAPSEQLKTVFQKFKEWLVEIYRSIKGSPLERKLNPKLKSVFDDMLTRGDTSTPPGRSVGAATPGETGVREGEIKRFTVLRTPLTEQYMKAVEEHYKGNVEWAEHPQQYAADAQEVLRKLDEEMKKLAPADLGGVRNAVVKTFGAVTPARKLYDPNLNPSAFSRLVSRVLFDFTTPTQEAFDNPISGQTFVPAEGLRMMYNGWAHEARIGLDEAFKEAWSANATHRMMDGTDATITRRNRKSFAEAVQEHIYATNEAARGHIPAPEAHPSIMKAASIVSDYYRKIGMDGKASGYLNDLIDPSLPHFTQQWLTDKIERNAGDFKRRLITQWEYNRNVDFATGQVMDPDLRTLKMDVVNPEKVRKGKNAGGLTDADREAINQFAKNSERPLEEITEIDLRDEFGPEMAQRYEQEVQIYFDKAADSTIESLTKIVSNKHGVLDAMDEIPADVRKGRLLQINPTRFADYLERDAYRLLESYDHTVSGRIASRMAVKRSAKLINPFYKELMGHSIAQDDYNPAKLIEAVNKHFQKYIEDERVPTDVRDQFSRARDVILGEKKGILTNKLSELEHRAAGSPVGWQLFLDRNLPRMPFMAQMGKVTLAAFNDLASLTFGRRIGNEQVGTLRTIIGNFAGKPRRDLEGFYVATIDAIRSLRGDEVSDYVPNLERGRFGGGLSGSVMSIADTSLGIAQKGLVAASGINRWSQAMRRTVSGQVLQDIIVGAKKMHEAANLVGQGFTQDKAFAKVGLAIEDARRLNRLGFNAERSKRLLKQIDAHGVDAFGNKVDSTHDGFISPEMSKWWKDDRDLFDALNNAVNSETLNLIVEPKILSRPLMNNTLLGKLFNQFQGFAMAWGTQLAPLAMQRGGHEIAMYAGLMVGLGAIADALRNELTGRRTINDSIEQWKKNPVGMAYGAIDRSGLTGWLSRPLGLLEHTPVGIGKMLKNDKLSSAYGRPGELIDQLGPVFGWSNKVYSGVVGSMYDGGWNQKNKMLLWRATPFNNLWAVEGFNRAAERMGFDTPIGPRFQYQGGR